MTTVDSEAEKFGQLYEQLANGIEEILREVYGKDAEIVQAYVPSHWEDSWVINYEAPGVSYYFSISDGVKVNANTSYKGKRPGRISKTIKRSRKLHMGTYTLSRYKELDLEADIPTPKMADIKVKYLDSSNSEKDMLKNLEIDKNKPILDIVKDSVLEINRQVVEYLASPPQYFD
jgi:hypothetical protein